MNPNATKISFIPKNPLVGQESFINRRRPRSALNILAGILFFISIGAYAGIYVYGLQLNNVIKQKTEGINKAYESFRNSKVIAQAKVFHARTQIGKELLDGHIILTPLFTFLQKNTLESVYFDSLKFTYTNNEPKLVVKGEAPGYASLAYQADVLRRENDAIQSFLIKDMKLTPTGSVGFSIEDTVLPSFISYTQSFKSAGQELTLQENSASLPSPEAAQSTLN